MGGQTKTIESRVVQEPNTGCWIWIGAMDKKGYGIQTGRGSERSIHRHTYQLKFGPIPKGMMLDHICRVRACVNPDHLRIVTPRENSIKNSIGPTAINAAKTHCGRGHEFTSDNTRCGYSKSAKGTCRKCIKCEKIDNAINGAKRGSEKLIRRLHEDVNCVRRCRTSVAPVSG